VEEAELNVDVAIVGAGPAGATLAALLARRGAEVALIDRDVFPRDKICGEFLSYDAFPILDLLGALTSIERAGCPPIEACRITGSRRSRTFRFPHPARGVSRRLFDELLVRTAGASGAGVREGWTVTSLDPPSRRLTIERGGTTQPLRARLIVGAWGRWGRFDARLGRSFTQTRSGRNFGFKRHYRRLAGPRDGTIELHSFAGGYLGVNDVEDGVTNICGLVDSSRLTGHKGRWDAFVESLRAEERHLDALYGAYEPAQPGFLSSDPVIFRARLPVEQGVFLTGDAAGLIDPLTGNGMAMAVQSALVAAPFVLAELSGKADAATGYAAAHAETFGRRIGWSRVASKLLTHPRLLDGALEVPGGEAVGRWFLDHTRGSVAIERLARSFASSS
jgi:flavin-dependent dehydrogenase